jgi:hypothetical protein
MTGNNPRGHPRQAGQLTGDSTTRAASCPGAADRDSSVRAVPVAFYGRTARAAGTGDSRADRHRQLALCRSVAAACGAWVTAEFLTSTAGPTTHGRAGRRVGPCSPPSPGQTAWLEQ